MRISLLTLEIQVSLAVLAILLLRPGMKRLPKVYSYGLWLLVFIRLLCPVSLESRLGIMPSREESNAWLEQFIQQAGGEGNDAAWGTGHGGAGAIYAGEEKKTENRVKAGTGTWTENRVKAGTKTGMENRTKNGTENRVNAGTGSGTKNQVNAGTENRVNAGTGSGTKNQVNAGAVNGAEIRINAGTVNGTEKYVNAGTANGTENQINAGEVNGAEYQINAGTVNRTENRINTGEEDRTESGTNAGEESGAENRMMTVLRDIWENKTVLLILILWACGLAGVLGSNAAVLLRIRRKMKSAELLWDNVYVSPDIPSPFTMGVVRPKVYLPAGLEQTERNYILCHEMIHIRRKDYLIKNIAFLLTAAHWFNPFVWAAFFLMERDMEMSCDEKVIRLMGADIKRRYSQSLLNFAVGKRSPAVTPLTFGENGVKQRVKNVLSYKSSRKWSLLPGVMILAVAGTALFTTRIQGEAQDAGNGTAVQKQTDKNTRPQSGSEDGETGQSGGQETQKSGQSTDTFRSDPEEVLERWGLAFVNRDMTGLLELADDRERLSAMAEDTRDGERLFGTLDTWPEQHLNLSYYRQEDGTGKIRCYFYTSEPEIFIVDETVKVVERDGSYYVEHQKLDEYFVIENQEQFERLYGDAGGYDFKWENTGYSIGFYRTILQHLVEGYGAGVYRQEADIYRQYTDPVEAAVRLLHLGAGEGKAEISPAAPESEEPWMSNLPEESLREGSLAVVEYTFSEDGSTVEIPMELIEGSFGIWAPAGSGMVRQVYKTREESDHAAEYFGWDEEESFYLQISQYGIYRVDKEHGLSCIYPYYIHPDTIWELQDGLMYVSLYEEYPSYMEWDRYYFQERPEETDYCLEAIGIVDVRTGEFDRESMRISGGAGRRTLLAPLNWMSLGGGFVHLYKTGYEGSVEEYAIPMVNTGKSSLTAGPMWNDMPVAELKGEELDTYGKEVRERLLGTPGMLLELSNRALTETYTYIDMDGDGKAEKISLFRDKEKKEERYWSYDSYCFQVGESRVTGLAECLNNGIWAVSLDGSEILLALYEDGPSNDPRTILYAYRGGEVVPAGSFEADIRTCTIEDGVIKGEARLDVLQTDWVKAGWHIGSDGILEWMKQESYDFTGLNEITLLTGLPLCDVPEEGGETHTMKPQKVRFLKTDGTFRWIYVQGADGDGGWFQVDGLKIVGLEKDYYEVFEGLNFAD